MSVKQVFAIGPYLPLTFQNLKMATVIAPIYYSANCLVIIYIYIIPFIQKFEKISTKLTI